MLDPSSTARAFRSCLDNNHRSSTSDKSRISRVQIFLLVRRAAAALGIAAGVAGALRLRGSGGVPPRSGGWRELSGNELE